MRRFKRAFIVAFLILSSCGGATTERARTTVCDARRVVQTTCDAALNATAEMCAESED